MAAPVPALSRDYYVYTSDNTNQYTVATLDANNAAQGTVQTPLADPLDHPAYPRGYRMRCVHGAYLDGSKVYRTKVPVFVPTDTLWTASSFSKFGVTWAVQSRIGERQTPRS